MVIEKRIRVAEAKAKSIAQAKDKLDVTHRSLIAALEEKIQASEAKAKAIAKANALRHQCQYPLRL